MDELETWDEIRKGFNFTQEEEAEMKFEMEIIQSTINARKKAGYSQRKLSQESGVKQPIISRIESHKSSPQVETLLKLLIPLGYTLEVVPLDKDEYLK